MTNDPTSRKPLTRRIARELRRWLWLDRRRPPSARPRIELRRDALEVHSLVCARDVPMSLWSLRSFVASSGLRPRVVIHDDGSLTPAHRRHYARHFDGITVLDDRAMSARMEQELAPWPACRRARQLPGFYCARKLLDILFVAESDAVLYIDSDILFFREPRELVAHARACTPCFSSDYQNSYGVPHAELQPWLGQPLEERVNSGLACLPIAAYKERLDLVERYLLHGEGQRRAIDPNRDEQTAHAVVMSVLGAARLSTAYALDGDLDEQTVSFHFVNDGQQRKRFWYVGVPRVRRDLAARLKRLVVAT